VASWQSSRTPTSLASMSGLMTGGTKGLAASVCRSTFSRNTWASLFACFTRFFPNRFMPRVSPGNEASEQQANTASACCNQRPHRNEICSEAQQLVGGKERVPRLRCPRSQVHSTHYWTMCPAIPCSACRVAGACRLRSKSQPRDNNRGCTCRRTAAPRAESRTAEKRHRASRGRESSAILTTSRICNVVQCLLPP